MEKFDMHDLKRLIDLTEYLKRKYPDVDIEITVKEITPETESSTDQLRSREDGLLSELRSLQEALEKYEIELDLLEDNMPDPYQTEHIDWLMRCGDMEDRIDDITARILVIEDELSGILRQLAARHRNG